MSDSVIIILRQLSKLSSIYWQRMLSPHMEFTNTVYIVLGHQRIV
jgi:hypothetical protein